MRALLKEANAETEGGQASRFASRTLESFLIARR
jgi:hypothetical protein